MNQYNQHQRFKFLNKRHPISMYYKKLLRKYIAYKKRKKKKDILLIHHSLFSITILIEKEENVF
jgi:hypothetical protein